MPRLIAKTSSFLLLLVLALVLSGRAAPALAGDSGAISGRVINDLNADGVSEAGEPGLVGWRVVLKGSVGAERTSVSYETMTDQNGKYTFTDLSSGDYTVSIPCDNPDLWLDRETSGSHGFALGQGEDHTDSDFALQILETPPIKNGAIYGRVVLDENRDGVPDPSESGLAGWQVEAWLHGSECLPSEYGHITGQTAEDGTFRLSEVIPGQYSIGVMKLGSFGDYVLDSSDNEIVVRDGSSESITIGVISIMGSGSISGEIYYDLNRNGAPDPGEPLWANNAQVGIRYRTPNGYALVSRPMDYVGGRYEFTGLAAGDYAVGNLSCVLSHAVNPPAGTDGIPEAFITLGEGEQRTGVDFGCDGQPPEPTPTEAVFPTPESPSLVSPTPMPSPHGGSSPSTGGGDSDPVAMPWLVAALGAGGLALIVGGALRLRRARRTRR